MNRTYIFVLVLVTIPCASMAGVKSKLAIETAEHLLGRFGKELGEESVETLAAKVGRYGLKYGDEAIECIRKTGPRAFVILDKAGENAPAVASLLSRYGSEAVWVASKPRNLAIFLRHGDDAARAMIKHPGLAEHVIEKMGQPAARAMQSVTSQNARRIAMMADDGTLFATGRSEELLTVISKYGDNAAAFIWKHKGALAVATLATAFVADPKVFLEGTQDLAEVALRPIDSAAKEIARGVAQGTQWTVVIIALATFGILLIFAATRGFLRGRQQSVQSKDSTSKTPKLVRRGVSQALY